MKLVVFAADHVGYQIVAYLFSKGDLPAAVVLHPSNPSGMNTEIGLLCVNAKVPLFGSENVCTELGSETIINLQPDMFLLAWWPSLMGENILAIPRTGTLNLHPSLLPFCRGKHPNFWSIVENVPFGVSIHWVTKRIDAGDIAFQQEIPVLPTDTGETLHAKAKRAIVDLFISAFPKIKGGDIPRIPQAVGTFHLSAELDEASEIKLDQCYSARHLVNILRARTYPPHPGAWFRDQGKIYELRIQITERTERI